MVGDAERRARAPPRTPRRHRTHLRRTLTLGPAGPKQIDPSNADDKGCNWCSFETDGTTPAAEWDAITYKYLGKLSKEHPDLCKRITFYDVWDENRGKPWYSDLVFNVSV